MNEPLAYHVMMLENLLRNQRSFDLIHFHCDFAQFLIAPLLSTPFLSTFHGRMDSSEVDRLLNSFSDHPLVSISNSQREGTGRKAWSGTIYNGLPNELYHFNDAPRDYFAFLGRTSPEKGLLDAIKICKKLNMKLKIAAKIDEKDLRYFEEEIKAHLDGHLIEYVGEIGEAQKQDFLGNAQALLFPIKWPEPFGMVMIESFACGTPVIAYDQGSVPEVVDHMISGIIVSGPEEAVAAARKIKGLDRKKVRERFESKFSQKVMVDSYEALYRKLVMERSSHRKEEMYYG